MKKFFISVFLLITTTVFLLNFDSYGNKNRGFQNNYKRGIGDKKLVECEFPEKWNVLNGINDQSPDFKIKSLNRGYDTIMYFLGRHYNTLYNESKIDKKKEMKASFFKDIIKLKNKEDNLKIDNAYFVKTIQNLNGVKIDLYKDGGVFNKFRVSEDFKVLNYLALVIKTEKGDIIDNKIVYYNCRNIIETDESYFYLADDLSLVIKKFYTDETNHYYKGKEKYKITNKGIKVYE